jgi:hypothetical protein
MAVYSANGNYFSNLRSGRVKYDMDYTGPTQYSLPKAPELIKACNEAAIDVFYNSSSDYDPVVFNPSTLESIYNDQIFFDVTNNRNFVVLSESISGTCLEIMKAFIRILSGGIWDDGEIWDDNASWED